jgi:DNA-binding IclR family transcriptional regulator
LQPRRGKLKWVYHLLAWANIWLSIIGVKAAVPMGLSRALDRTARGELLSAPDRAGRFHHRLVRGRFAPRAMTPKAAGTARPRVSTIEKVGRLLKLFTPQRRAWRLTDLARELEWDLSTTLRLATALVDIRLLSRRPDDRYEVGPFTAELGSIHLGMDRGRQEMVALLESTSRDTGLTTQLGVLSQGAVTIWESCEAAGALKAAAMLGERLPLHATAAGKALLAGLPDEQVLDLLPAELEVFTSQTVTSVTALLAELAEVRKTGIAYADGELAHGLYAVATALAPGRYGRGPAAFTCVGMSPSIDPQPWATAEQILRRLT